MHHTYLLTRQYVQALFYQEVDCADLQQQVQIVWLEHVNRLQQQLVQPYVKLI